MGILAHMCVEYLHLSKYRVSNYNMSSGFPNKPITTCHIQRGSIQGVWLYTNRDNRVPGEYRKARAESATVYSIQSVCVFETRQCHTCKRILSGAASWIRAAVHAGSAQTPIIPVEQ